MALHTRKRNLLRFKKLAEQKSLARQCLGALVMREQVDEFVAEDGDATRLKTDDRNSGLNFRRELIEDLQQQGFGSIEHAVVVERAAAAQVGAGNDDAIAGVLQNFDGGACGGGQ